MCSRLPSFWSCDVFILIIKFLWHLELTQPHWWHFEGKAELDSPQCHHHWTLRCHCCLDEHWHLVTSLKTQEFKKLICTKEIKKIIYNKLVFKNTKITSVTSVMPTTWRIYTCRKGSDSVIWTAVPYDEQTAAMFSHWQKAYSKYFVY